MLHTACSGFNQRCFARQALKALSPRLRLGLQHLSQGPSDRRPLFSALLRMTGPKRSSQLLPEASGNGDAQATKQGKSGDRDIAVELLDFINEAWTQYHAVAEASRRLEEAGFRKVSEREPWDLNQGGRYYFTRNLSTLVAFAVGQEYSAGNPFHMIGAHTDSPCLKLKPRSKGKKPGFQMVNVEPYGGGLWHTWFDRDLTVAGCVLVREGDQLTHRLVKVKKPILRIPMLAIHLNRELADKGFLPNKQQHLAPILATEVQAAAAATPSQPPAGAAAGEDAGRHHPALLRVLGQTLGLDPSAIVDFDLNVCDTQPGTIGGVDDEFINVGRLDNLGMSFCALTALLDTFPGRDSLQGESAVKAVALFDHEEVGSSSAQGAGGPVMRDTITRVASHFGSSEPGVAERALAASFLVSADMAHAQHPNYADKHEPDHRPQFGKGLVIKHNANQRYATNSFSATLFRELARPGNTPVQEFVIKSDLACGSTIGPILASGLGCRTVDVGSPQLAMHSIREMAACADVAHAYNHFCAFFKDFTSLDRGIDLDSLPAPAIQGSLDDVECSHLH